MSGVLPQQTWSELWPRLGHRFKMIQRCKSQRKNLQTCKKQTTIEIYDIKNTSSSFLIIISKSSTWTPCSHHQLPISPFRQVRRGERIVSLFQTGPGQAAYSHSRHIFGRKLQQERQDVLWNFWIHRLFGNRVLVMVEPQTWQRHADLAPLNTSKRCEILEPFEQVIIVYSSIRIPYSCVFSILHSHWGLAWMPHKVKCRRPDPF